MRAGHAMLNRPWLVVVGGWQCLFAAGEPKGKAHVLHTPSLVAGASPLIPMLTVTVFLLFVCVYSLVSLYFTVCLCNRQIFIGLICNEALKVFM
jgi:hypothetical protein